MTARHDTSGAATSGPHPHPGAPLAQRDERELLEELRATGDPGIREALIHRGMRLVHHVAQRYDRRGVDYEELLQVGSVGLINAVDGFDPARGTRFSTFAVPHIQGEIRRHFRDRGWAMRVGRTLQERHALVTRVSARLLVELQRYPSTREVAAAAELTVSEVLEALDAARQYTSASLDAPLSADAPDCDTAHDQIGTRDAGYAAVDARLTVEAAVQTLRPRERDMLRLRFDEELKQSEIGERLGLSQMHVSRLLTETFNRLRGVIDAEPDAA